MFGYDLPADVEEILKVTRDFVKNELRPAEEAIEAFVDPEEAYTSDAFKGILGKLHEMGFHKLTTPEEMGGLGLSQFAGYLVTEELAVGGAGLASHMLVAPLGAMLVNMFQLQSRLPVYKEYAEAYLDDTRGTHSGCWAITEPDVGSDIFTFDEEKIRFRTKAQPQEGGGPVAVKEGAGYRIDGGKSAFVSNGWYSDMILLMAAVETGGDMNGTGTFLIPTSVEGITKGRPLNKLGLRALNQSEIFFDSVWVPEEMLVVPPGPAYRMLLEFIVTAGNTSVGLLATGVATAAFQYGLAHAKERVQGGKPIFEHQLVKQKLFDAFRTIEASRALLWKSAWLASEGRGDVKLAMAARTVASETVMKVTSDMVQLLGGYGISKEYPVEKYYRDAKLLSIMDGTIDRVSMFAASML